MAAAISNSNPTQDTADMRRAALRRMKRVAGGLLAVMFLLFAATTWAEPRWPDHQAILAAMRAFAEAAMVGAIADWFAVVALFRRPFGLPIPHTAIIPRNKDRIGRALGTFICNNFLAPDLVAAKLDSLDVAGRAATWATRPHQAERLARRVAALTPAILVSLDDEATAALARKGLIQAATAIPAAPLVARVLAAWMAKGRHQALFDMLVDAAAHWLENNGEPIRQRVSDRSWHWLPRWIDRKLADKIMDGTHDTLAELRDPNHPWRAEFDAVLERFRHQLATDPRFRARGEALKTEMLASPVMAETLDQAWTALSGRLRTDLSADESVLRQGLEAAISGIAGRAAADPHLRAVANRWLRRLVERLVVPNRAEIGDFIAGVVARWDSRTVTDKLELQVGRDLQYIRINGTLVGGLVGLAIHILSHLLG